MLVALIPLTLSIFLTAIVDQRQPRLQRTDTNLKQGEEHSGRNALQLMFSGRFLLAVALIAMLLN